MTWATEVRQVSADDVPLLAWRRFSEERLVGDELASAVWSSYMAQRFPLRRLPRGNWVEMFKSAGFLRDGRRAERPEIDEPLVLFRGATPEFADGLSWTTSAARAASYARDPLAGRVYRCEVEADRLLGVVSVGGSAQLCEHVTDVTGLPVEVVV